MYEFYLTSLSHVKSLGIFSARVETPATSQLDMLAVALGRFEGGFDPSFCCFVERVASNGGMK